MNIPPKFSSRYSFPLDINKTIDKTVDITPLTKDLEAITGPKIPHWSLGDHSITLKTPAGEVKTLPVKGGVYYIESGVNQEPTVIQSLLSWIPSMRKKTERLTDAQVEAALQKNNIAYTKEDYSTLG